MNILQHKLLQQYVKPAAEADAYKSDVILNKCMNKNRTREQVPSNANTLHLLLLEDSVIYVKGAKILHAIMYKFYICI